MLGLLIDPSCWSVVECLLFIYFMQSFSNQVHSLSDSFPSLLAVDPLLVSSRIHLTIALGLLKQRYEWSLNPLLALAGEHSSPEWFIHVLWPLNPFTGNNLSATEWLRFPSEYSRLWGDLFPNRIQMQVDASCRWDETAINSHSVATAPQIE